MFQTTNQWLLTIINHHYPILNQCSNPPPSQYQSLFQDLILLTWGFTKHFTNR
jgi:hypothetical protein